MKKYIVGFWLLFLMQCALDGYAINIPHHFGCDTIFMRGDYAQLKQIEANIVAEIKKPVNQATKAALYALMGDTQTALGCYESALKWYRLGINIFHTIDYAKPENEADRYYYAQCLYSYANLQLMVGEETNSILENYSKAVDVFKDWIPYANKNLSNSYISAQVIYGVFQVQYVLGTLSSLVREFSLAMDEYEECIKDMETDVFPKNLHQTMEYAQVLCSMADVYERSSDYEQALDYFQQALVVAERVAGRNSVLYAQILGRIGGVYYTLNDLNQAADCFMRSVRIFEGKGFKEHSELGVAFSGIGMVALNLKEYELSSEYFLKAYEMQKKVCGENSYRTELCKLYTAYSPLLKGDYDSAWKLASEAVMENSSIGLNHASDNFLNSAVFVFDIGLLRQEYDEIIDLHGELTELIDVYRNVAHYPLRNLYLNLGRAYRRKGDYKNAVVQFNKTLELQRTIAHDNFSFLTEEQRSNLWAVDETRINSLFCVNQAGKPVAPEIGELLYDVALLNKGILLQASINLAEVVRNSGDEALKRKLSDFRLLKQELAATGKGETEEAKRMESEIVQAAKKYGDFMEYANLTWQDVKSHLGKNDVAIEFVSSFYGGVYTYSAEVLRADMSAPRHIKLFTITANQLALLHASPGRYSSFSKNNVWTAELLRLLNPGDNVYFVPTGELYNIGIEYMPLPDGRRMCDVYQMHRLSSTREIATSRKGSLPHTGVLFGGLNYNSSLSDMELYAYAVATRGGERQRFGLHDADSWAAWNYLPGTIKEVASISASLQESRYAVETYTGNEGVEEAFKTLSNKQTEIIHIATHGFYQPNKGDDLQNSGLIFAGANNFWNAQSGSAEVADIDDGILTAKEISLLNLQGTDLLVMSACQTGLGRVTGEGVFGLQRAFKKAGVQTLLMSLWEVDDEATQLMMSEFYKAYTSGQSKRAALRTAQSRVKQHTFYRDGKPVSGSDPYYWAAFIMMD